jgi:hypothetical protein
VPPDGCDEVKPRWLDRFPDRAEEIADFLLLS